MEFGDKEWFKGLERLCKFPSVFAFYVGSDKTINSREIGTKAENVGNIQYKMLAPSPLFSGESVALVSVLKCETPQAYYEECKRLREIWGTPTKEPVK